MELGLQGKKVLITGANKGIGYAVAESFLAEGAYVCITGRDKVKLEKAVYRLGIKYSSSRLLAFEGDVLNKNEIDKLKVMILRNWGNVDIIIPNIGCGKSESSNVLNVDEWKRMFEVNLLGGVQLLDGFSKLLNVNGSIVMISSIVAREVFGSSIAYAASKGSILTLVKYLAKNMAQDGVRVNCVVPGNIRFPDGRWEELIKNDEAGVREMIEKNVPMQRFGKPEEIAAAVVFLASERASFITGAALVVDGGQTNTIG